MQHPRGRAVTAIADVGLEDRFLAGIDGEGLFAVTPAGAEPLEPGTGIEADHVTSLAGFRDAGNLVLLATTWGEAIYRSSDLGASWQHFSDGLFKNEQADCDEFKRPHFGRVLVSDDHVLFLASFCGVFRSDSRGRTWYKFEITFDSVAGLDVAPVGDSELELAVSTYGSGMLASRDRGGSWRIENTGLHHPRLGPIAY